MGLDAFKGAFVRGDTVDRQAMTFLVTDAQGQQLVVFYAEDESVGIKPIKKICERMVTQSITKGVLVYQKNLTPSANKVRCRAL
jgi:DNA-directed RNA polymerases I, II, and III subunit RPABC1